MRGKRPDLDDLYDAVNAAHARHAAAQQHLEEVTQSSGFLARLRIASIASHLKRREMPPAKTEDEKRERAEAILVEVVGDLHHLREAVRPEEARGPLDPEARGALKRYESDLKQAIADLHRALRPRVEEVEVEVAPKGWAALDTSQKIQIFAIGVTFLGIVVGSIVTISIAR